jgi:hypothetical protein
VDGAKGLRALIGDDHTPGEWDAALGRLDDAFDQLDGEET